MTTRKVFLPRPFISTLPGVRPRHMPLELLADRRWVPLGMGVHGKLVPINWMFEEVEDPIEVYSADDANAIAERPEVKNGRLAYFYQPSAILPDLISIRLVHSFDLEKSRFRKWALPIVDSLMSETYWQRFANGTGIEFLVRGSIELDYARYGYESSPCKIEVLQGERFIVMTGDNDFTVSISHCQRQLDELKRKLVTDPCLVCGRPTCLGHEPWDPVGSIAFSEAGKTHATMKRVANSLDELRIGFGSNLIADFIWHKAITKTVDTRLSIDLRVRLLRSWSQRQCVPLPGTSISELVKAFDKSSAPRLTGGIR